MKKSLFLAIVVVSIVSCSRPDAPPTTPAQPPTVETSVTPSTSESEVK